MSNGSALVDDFLPIYVNALLLELTLFTLLILFVLLILFILFVLIFVWLFDEDYVGSDYRIALVDYWELLEGIFEWLDWSWEFLRLWKLSDETC